VPNLISIFIPALEKKPAATLTVDEFISNIKYGEWELEVTPIRECKDKKKRDEMKKGVTGVTISGTFTPTRNQDNLVEHSGYICIDIDGFTDRSSLIEDPYTYALFSSISNNGMAVIVRINPEKHKESFRWLQQYYFKQYGIPVDPAPSNPASLRFISFDPHTFINEKSRQSRILVKKPKTPPTLPTIYPTDTVSELVKTAINQGVNIAQDYQDYVNLGFAIANGFSEQGREYFHALSGVSEKYNSSHCDRQYDLCLKRSSTGITVGTFYWMLKNAGIKLPRNKQYETATTLAVMAKKSGRKKEGVIEQLTTINKIPKEDATRIVSETYDREDIELKTIAGDPEKLIESLMEWLNVNHPLRMNEITGKVEEAPKPDMVIGREMGRERMNTIYLRARAAFNTPNINFDLVERMIYSDFTPHYNPLKEYIVKNEHRNTSGNIDRLCKSIKSDTIGYELFIRKWLLCIPASIQGHPVRLVLALLGAQMTGKTEFFRRLLPPTLQKYYGESKMDAGKDDELLMCNKLILMDDEMGGKSRTDEKRFKELTSKSIFSLRAPYGRYNEDYKRLALLCGTSNDPEVINDPTGNTRILPINIISMDHEMYNGINKDELFMEVVRLYESGEDFNLTRPEMDHLSTLSSEFEVIAFERELILKFFSPDLKSGFTEFLTATEIKDHIESNSKQRIMSMKRFGTELKSIFGKRKAKFVGGKTVQLYTVARNVVDSKTSSQSGKSKSTPDKTSDTDSAASDNPQASLDLPPAEVDDTPPPF